MIIYIEKIMYNDHNQSTLSENVKDTTINIFSPTTQPIAAPMPSVLPVSSSHGNQPLVVIVRPSTKPTYASSTTEPITAPTTEPTAAPTADPSTEPTNDYSPMPVPPVDHANGDQPLLVIVLPKPTHAPSTTEPITAPTTEPTAVPTAHPSTEPTNDYYYYYSPMPVPPIFQVTPGDPPVVVFPTSTVKPSSLVPSTVTPSSSVPSTATPSSSVPSTVTPSSSSVPSNITPSSSSVPSTVTPSSSSVPSTITPSDFSPIADTVDITE
jgi:hypothetical protein